MKRIFFLLLSILLFLSSCSPIRQEDGVFIDVLDIGKADCIVIRHNGKCMMIDTGEKENAPEILSFLQTKKITHIDTLVLTHFDKDHIGSAAEIIRTLNVGEVLQSSFDSDRPEFDEYNSELEAKNKAPTIITTNYLFELGECKISVFPPKQSKYEKKQDNNASLIVKISYQSKNFLFLADAMEDRISEFLQDTTDQFDFIKLPYHGKYLENYPEFFNKVKFQYAAITCSNKNPAHKDTLMLLEKNNVNYFLTKNGNINIFCKDDKCSITQ